MPPPDYSQLDGLIFHGSDTPRDRFFLFGQPERALVACWNPTARSAVTVTIIEDNQLAKACAERLRSQGYPVFASWPEVYAHAAREGWPGWEQYWPPEG